MTTVAFLALAVLAPARHVTLELFDAGQKLSTIEWREQLGDKGKVVTLDFRNEKNSNELVRKRKITYDLEGIRVRDEIWAKMKALNGSRAGARMVPMDVHFVIEMNSEFTAHQILTMGRNKTTTDYTMPAGSVVLDPSQYWFFKDQPEKDKEFVVSYYDPMQGGWHGYLKKFAGQISTDVAGKRVDANLVEVQRDGIPIKEYYDDQGLPLLIEDGTRRMVRKW